MTDWVTCANCQLKHRLRPDCTCPRCGHGLPAVSAPPAPVVGHPDVKEAPPLPRPDLPALSALAVPERLPLGARFAGIVMALNGAVSMMSRVLMPGVDSPLGPATLSSGVVDVLIGLALASGYARIRVLALVRVAIGALVFTPWLAYSSGWVMAALQALLSSSLLLLLAGAAGRRRLVLGGALAALCLGIEGLSVLGAPSGRSPLVRLALLGQLEAEPVAHVEGRQLRWQLEVPSSVWYLRKVEAARKGNPSVDRWLVRPDRDAHVLVIGEVLSVYENLEIGRVVQTVLRPARKAATRFEILDSNELAPQNGEARLVHTRSAVAGLEMEAYYGVFVYRPHVYQVVAFASPAAFRDLAGELEGIVRSFVPEPRPADADEPLASESP